MKCHCFFSKARIDCKGIIWTSLRKERSRDSSVV